MPNQDYSSPGPVYNTAQMGKKTAAISHKLGLSKRTQINHWVQKTPAPSTYTPVASPKMQTISFPKANPQQKLLQTPDGGCYNPQHKQTKHKAGVYSLGSRYKSIMDEVNRNPGPGDYQNSTQMTGLEKSKSKRGNLFSSAKRFAQVHSSPGVGDYEIRSKKAQYKDTIGNGLRDPVTKDNFPGPSQYAKKSCFEQMKLGKSMSQKLSGCFQENKVTVNAFNNYFEKQSPPQLNFTSSKRYSMPRSPRKVFQPLKLPGPHDYFPQTQHKNSPKAVIPQSTYLVPNDTLPFPGPGAYTLKHKLQPQYSIGRAKSAAHLNTNPGAGRYSQNRGIQTKRGNAFGRSHRTNFISANIAGVGDYEIKDRPNIGRSIGKANRFPKQKDIPGPGDYNLNTIIGYKTRHN